MISTRTRCGSSYYFNNYISISNKIFSHFYPQDHVEYAWSYGLSHSVDLCHEKKVSLNLLHGSLSASLFSAYKWEGRWRLIFCYLGCKNTSEYVMIGSPGLYMFLMYCEIHAWHQDVVHQYIWCFDHHHGGSKTHNLGCAPQKNRWQTSWFYELTCSGLAEIPPNLFAGQICPIKNGN